MSFITIAAMSVALTLSTRLNSYPSPSCRYGDLHLAKSLEALGLHQQSKKKTRTKVCHMELILHRLYGENTLRGIDHLLTRGFPIL